METFVVERTVEWGECDPAGIVFYSNYFAWMDSAFHRLTRSFGVDQASLQRDHGIFGTPIVDAQCVFKSPAKDGHPVSVEVSVRDLGERAATILYLFRSGDRVLAQGHEKRVAVRREGDSITAAPLPDSLIQGLRIYHVG